MHKRPDCEPYLLRLSYLLNINFDGIEKDSIIEHRKKTTQTNYILYGPGCHSFISVLTYEISKDPNIKFAPILLLCHKIQKSIYAYSFTNQIQSDLFSSSTREVARNNALIYVFFQSSYNINRDYHDYGFGNTLLYLKPEECLPSVRFWNAPGVLNLFKFHSDTNVIVEYPKVPGHKDFDKQRRQIIVYKN
jgi:hypothetical protein